MNEREVLQQTQVRSFRISEEVAEKIKRVQGDLKLTQDAALKRMIQAYELEQAKELIPERETEIANFQVKAQEMVEAFLHSLQLNQDAEVRIRAEFVEKLQMRDRAILDYQEKNKELQEKIGDLSDAAEQAHALRTELEQLKEQARVERNDAADRLAEKERLIKTLDARLVVLEKQADGYDELRAERDSLQAKLSAAMADMATAAKDHQIAMERAAFQAEKEKRDAVAEAKAAGAAVEAALRQELHDAKVSAANALKEAEQAAHASDNASAEEIRKLEQENARLREKLAAQKQN